MGNMNEYQFNEERYKDMMRSAERERLARSARRERSAVRKALGQGLVALGEQLLNDPER
jgi:hypothetical protein